MANIIGDKWDQLKLEDFNLLICDQCDKPFGYYFQDGPAYRLHYLCNNCHNRPKNGTDAQ